MRNRPFTQLKRSRKPRRVADQFDKINSMERQRIGRFVSDIHNDHYEHFLECINESPKLKHLESFSSKFLYVVDLKQQNEHKKFINRVL